MRSKHDFIRRFIVGEFGNRTPVWWRVTDVPPDYAGELCFRGLQPGFRTVYNVRRPWPEQPPGTYVSSMVPKGVEAEGLLQGEVMRTEGGLYLYYSRLPIAMKPALEQGGRHAWMLEAKVLLEHFMCPNSYTWLQHLLDTYTDHVVEFSAYSTDYGVLPGNNTLFWEVRNY